MDLYQFRNKPVTITFGGNRGGQGMLLESDERGVWIEFEKWSTGTPSNLIFIPFSSIQYLDFGAKK